MLPGLTNATGRGCGRYLLRDIAEGAVHGVIFALWQADTAVRDYLEDWAEEDPSVYAEARRQIRIAPFGSTCIDSTRRRRSAFARCTST